MGFTKANISPEEDYLDKKFTSVIFLQLLEFCQEKLAIRLEWNQKEMKHMFYVADLDSDSPQYSSAELYIVVYRWVCLALMKAAEDRFGKNFYQVNEADKDQIREYFKE